MAHYLLAVFYFEGLLLHPARTIRLDHQNVDGAADGLRSRLKPKGFNGRANSKDAEINSVLKGEVIPVDCVRRLIDILPPANPFFRWDL